MKRLRNSNEIVDFMTYRPLNKRKRNMKPLFDMLLVIAYVVVIGFFLLEIAALGVQFSCY